MDYKSLVGKMVRVVMDRPLGSKHPKFDTIYPVNYGYVPGTLAGDGMEIDAYVLGINKPLAEFEGNVIAIIHRSDDVEDKLVVAAPGVQLSDDAIWSAVEFQERYFDSHILR